MCKFGEEGKHISGLVQVDLLNVHQREKDDAFTALRSWERTDDFDTTTEFMVNPFEGIRGSTDRAQLLRQAEECDSTAPVSAST